MVAKQSPGTYSPDGSKYACPTDGVNTLVSIPTSSTGTPKQARGSQAPDGSIYMTLTDGAGTLT